VGSGAGEILIAAERIYQERADDGGIWSGYYVTT
jgi:hypothetical protein